MTSYLLPRETRYGLMLGGSAGLTAVAFFSPLPAVRLAAITAAVVPVAAALAWWMLCGATRWIYVFLLAAVLLPPVALAWGDTGVHPAVLVAAIGLLAGLARPEAWEVRLRPVALALSGLWFSLWLSCPMAALSAGPSIAGGSLARVGLFGIAVYTYLYLIHGPGRDLRARRLIQVLFWGGVLSALFACLDFRFQFPAPARFAGQFVWLPAGVLRRAQGVFYESSTLGLLCVFLLVMIAAVIIRGQASSLGLSWPIVAGGMTCLLTALVLSFSRGALVGLAVSVLALVGIEIRRRSASRRVLRFGAALVTALIAGAAILYWLRPDFLSAYLERLWFSAVYLGESPNLILSRRVDSWRVLLTWLQSNPWAALTGVGYKTLPYSDVVGGPAIADNLYLCLLVETGLAGLAALVWLHWAVLRACYRAAIGRGERARSDSRPLFGCWMFAFWCGLVVQMFSADILTYWRILPAFFAALAIVEREQLDERPVP